VLLLLSTLGTATLLVFAVLAAYIVRRTNATRVGLKAKFRDVFDFSLLADSPSEKKLQPRPNDEL
jgi:hypothetical protein